MHQFTSQTIDKEQMHTVKNGKHVHVVRENLSFVIDMLILFVKHRTLFMKYISQYVIRTFLPGVTVIKMIVNQMNTYSYVTSMLKVKLFDA